MSIEMNTTVATNATMPPERRSDFVLASIFWHPI
jgi:hypothetical protein